MKKGRGMKEPSSGSSLRAVLFGGNANNGANAGFANSNSNNDPSNTNANIGSRLNLTPFNKKNINRIPRPCLLAKQQKKQKGVGRTVKAVSKTPLV